MDTWGFIYICWYKSWSSSGVFFFFFTWLWEVLIGCIEVKIKDLFCVGRFGMEHSARESEQWEVIKRELVSWHGTRGSYHQGAETETSSNMISESRATTSASSWDTNLKSAGWSGLMMIESLRLEATIIRSSWNLSYSQISPRLIITLVGACSFVTVVSVEQSFTTTYSEADWAYSSSQGDYMVSSSEQPPCFRRWNGRQVH